MAHLTINIPEELVDDLRRELCRALVERAAALRRALDGYLDSGGSLDHVEGALVEVRDLDQALAQLAGPAGPVSVTAHPEVLTDALRALLHARPGDAVLQELVRVVNGGVVDVE
jgi:hypothetical protein